MSDLNEIYENLKRPISDNEKKNRRPLFVSILSKSRFRNHHFKYLVQNSIPYFNERAGKKIKYSDVCKLICEYVKSNNLYIDNGTIKCDDFLKQLSGRDTVTFIWLLSKFSMILQ
jgi:hypothetical protein